MSDSTYEVEALFEGLRRLHAHVSPWMPAPRHVQAAYPGDALGEALPAHWTVFAVDAGGIDG